MTLTVKELLEKQRFRLPMARHGRGPSIPPDWQQGGFLAWLVRVGAELCDGGGVQWTKSPRLPSCDLLSTRDFDPYISAQHRQCEFESYSFERERLQVC